jgi:hypothetical protein
MLRVQSNRCPCHAFQLLLEARAEGRVDGYISVRELATAASENVSGLHSGDQELCSYDLSTLDALHSCGTFCCILTLDISSKCCI